MEYRQELLDELNAHAKSIRRGVVECIGVGVAGHLGGGNSCADIVAALYCYKMKFDPQNPTDPDRDRFLLSKGHAAIVQYAALAEVGVFPREELKTTKCLGSRLQGHPDVRKTPGIEAGTGSLGQGLSIGLGMALGQRLDGLGRKTYVILGDGELAEGQVWEAVMAAQAFKASNLVAIIDNNRLQATGPIQDRFDTGDLRAKFEGFGWNVLDIDGHDMRQILQALDAVDTESDRPTAILAHTVKGKGVSFAENVVGFHNGALTQEQYQQALRELA